MRLKRILVIFMAFLLVIPAFLASAETNSSEKKNLTDEGAYSAKHEVVYATLNAAGKQEEMYVVNNFTIEKPGTIIDHGPYTGIKNLTDMTDIKKQNGQIEFSAGEEEFYYQGNLEGKPLPWDIDISYKLNGKTISAEKLLGKDGRLEIQIGTAANEEADQAFFNNYLLQITLTFDAAIYKNIEAPDGTIANAGKNRQVTFTVMPEKEGHFMIRADVSDFEMEGIEIAAVPSSMSIDAPDTGAMKKDMHSLSDATSEINKGVSELQKGIAKLHDGAASLQNGSQQYKNGINDLQDGSSELVQGSSSIKASLEQMSGSVGAGSGDMNLDELKKLEDGLRQIAAGLSETEKGLTDLNTSYSQAYHALDQAMEGIPAYQISEADIKALHESGADPKVINQLTETYRAALTAKGTYGQVKEGFAAVGPALDQTTGSLNEMSAGLITMADNLGSSLDNMNLADSMKQLEEGLQALSSNYGDFHAGLAEYTGGVAKLAESYQDLHNGIGGLKDGGGKLENGAAELHEGTSELASSTSDLPEQMQREIDEMMNEYDKSDFEPVSFVSPENEKVESVQFVIKTESIKKAEQDKDAPEHEEEKSFWDRLLDLFR
ncbi:hypothetical protein [Bacillus marinisedimentorum]|uniref:hypothetical protein n=1 Tax=Bacillus marinisedimentorum TaxID=1821260 RepID=UPI0007DE7C2A|nr:hypothetical protein [Bacillus marinisedimentorum]